MRATLAAWLLSLASAAPASILDPIEAPLLPTRVQDLLAAPPYAGGSLPRLLDRAFRENCTQRTSPFSVVGDFDADGRDDLAFWWLSTSAPAAERSEARLLVFETRAARLVELDHLPAHPAARLPPLDLHRAGARIHDFHRSASLRLAHDTVASIVCWKTSTAWLRRADGRYVEALTSD
jgi:hypothetical protein